MIGNPPYQEEAKGENTAGIPIYHKFIDEAYKVSSITELITPARFLFNAGQTPTSWNQKMLNNPHLKIVFYSQDSSKIFSNTDIKGGVAISYHDVNQNFGSIETFISYPELQNIMKKAAPETLSESLAEIIYTQTKFNLEELYKNYPEYKKIIGSKGQDKRFRNNIFEKIPAFTEEPQSEDDIKVLGLANKKRVYRYLPRKFVDMTHKNLNFFKVFVPRSNGSGAIGEVLSTPLIGAPLIGYTQTFIGIGAFTKESEAESCLKYIKSKFARTMLGILKITQDNNRDTWRKVPLQDFTLQSDINWSLSIPEIDQQLYAKYGLSADEINFIESKVKEMN
ncbi:restriction endonuclease [Enterococcus canis]|uniref:Restriction endonuclease n=1 Tax=Enterococcus canis TaxID=214095 RepID=A0A1L8RK62_9ENTE|nr:restriction endonuclease [Enterococcus canis]